MNAAILLQLARVFGTLSLVSIGGVNAILPEIRRQVVDHHGWLAASAFADTFAISHVAPGPNTIMVSLIGWQVAGLVGLLVATAAMILPSCALAFAAARLLGRWQEHRRIRLLKAGLVPVALGLILASGVVMMRTADHGVLTVVISLATAAFVVGTTRNPLWALALGTAINVAARHLGT